MSTDLSVDRPFAKLIRSQHLFVMLGTRFARCKHDRALVSTHSPGRLQKKTCKSTAPDFSKTFVMMVENDGRSFL